MKQVKAKELLNMIFFLNNHRNCNYEKFVGPFKIILSNFILYLQGDRVVLLRKIDNNWYEGRLNDSEGIFPADYIDILREPKGNFSFEFFIESIDLVQQTMNRLPKH